MSSPLFYPRVQWWEYDFRYRGDLKTMVKHQDKTYEARLTDLRRDAGCVELFENLSIDDTIKLEIDFNGKVYGISAIVKTITELLPGRPLRYGVKIDIKDVHHKNNFLDLKRSWSESNKVKLRRKFTKIKSVNND